MSDLEISYLSTANQWIAVNQQWAQLARKLLKRYDLTYPQFRVLYGLNQADIDNKRISQAQLSFQINMDTMTLSTIIRNLESRRLIKRQESRSDTRAKNVYITPVGKSLVEDAEQLMEMAAESFFTQIFDVQQIKQFNDLNVEDLQNDLP